MIVGFKGSRKGLAMSFVEKLQDRLGKNADCDQLIKDLGEIRRGIERYFGITVKTGYVLLEGKTYCTVAGVQVKWWFCILCKNYPTHIMTGYNTNRIEVADKDVLEDKVLEILTGSAELCKALFYQRQVHVEGANME